MVDDVCGFWAGKMNIQKTNVNKHKQNPRVNKHKQSKFRPKSGLSKNFAKEHYEFLKPKFG